MVYTPTNDWIVCSRSGKKMRVRGSESVEYAPRRWWWVEKWYFRAFSWCTSSRVFVCGKICLCECVACADVYHRVTIHNTYYSMPHYVHKNNRTLAVRDRATEKECVDTDNNHVINVRVQGTQARHRIQGFVIVLRCACVKLHCMLYAIHSLLHTSQSTSKSASSFPNHTHTHVRQLWSLMRRNWRGRFVGMAQALVVCARSRRLFAHGITVSPPTCCGLAPIMAGTMQHELRPRDKSTAIGIFVCFTQCNAIFIERASGSRWWTTTHAIIHRQK